MYETKHIDIKLIIFITIVIVLVILGIFLIINFSSSNSNSNKTTILTSTDKKYTIEIPKSIKYKVNTNPNNDFTIDLYSEEDEMFMYATTIEKSHDIDLRTIATDDKTMYFKDKENIREDSRHFRN